MSPAVAYLSKSISILNNLLQMCYTAFESVFSSVSVSAQRRIIPVKSASLLWNTRPKLCTLRYARTALYTPRFASAALYTPRFASAALYTPRFASAALFFWKTCLWRYCRKMKRKLLIHLFEAFLARDGSSGKVSASL